MKRKTISIVLAILVDIICLAGCHKMLLSRPQHCSVTDNDKRRTRQRQPRQRTIVSLTEPGASQLSKKTKNSLMFLRMRQN